MRPALAVVAPTATTAVVSTATPVALAPECRCPEVNLADTRVPLAAPKR